MAWGQPPERTIVPVSAATPATNSKDTIMGWLFTPGSTLKSQIAERTKGWQHVTPDGMTVNSTSLAHCYRGGAFSGVLWTVWERTFEKNGQQVRPTERWIGCDLLQFSKHDLGWGYKDMEESMGPYFYSCPLKYLDMVPQVASESWREGVRQYHARQLEKRRSRRAAKLAV
jgi:hypothetical protein